MRALLKLSFALVAVAGSAPLGAQNANSLAGAWERFSLKDSSGTAQQPPAGAAFLIMTADGFYSQMTIPAGRAKVDKPLAEYTKEELLARFQGVEARRGRYTISGNTISRTYEAAANPNQEGGAPQVQQFRIEGDVLILSSPRAGNMSEARFRRAK